MGIFFFFGGSRNKKFHVGHVVFECAESLPLDHQGASGHVEFETTIRLPSGARYSFGCTYLEFRTIS